MNADELYRRLRSQQIPELIFLFGQETYLVQRAVNAIREAVLPGGKDDFNDNQFSGKQATAALILEAAMTFPVFAEKRLVTVKEAHQFPAAELEKIIPYLLKPIPDTCLLFVADKIDNRRKFFQQFKKYGALIEFKPLTDYEVPRHVRQVLQEARVQITNDGLELFCMMVDGNLHEIHAELDKLLTYIGTATLIEYKHVEAVVSRGRVESVFELGKAVGSGDAAKGLLLVMRLTAAGEPPLKILSLLTRHFRQLWQTREMQVNKCPVGEISKVIGAPPFAVKELVRQGRKFNRNDFQQAFELFLETDLAMKSSGANTGALLDNLILKLIRIGAK